MYQMEGQKYGGGRTLKVSDYIAEFLVQHNIADVFMVAGGGAMHLDDSFGHCTSLHCTCCHHEQAAAMAAEAYARVENRMAALCVTTGPGATNAITGVAGAWMDSISMLVFSGQARYETTIYASGLKLRTRGVQEFDIIGSVQNMTKYCELVKDPQRIRYVLEKAYYLATTGRPGPCWLDIPLDVQGTMICPDELERFTPEVVAEPDLTSAAREILQRIREAKRPVILAGNGIRLAGAHSAFLNFVEKAGVPVVTTVSSVDGFASDHPFFAGRCGTTGDRAGNLAVQNADLLITLGSRLSYFVTGFADQLWATNAYKIVNDIDANEIEKSSIHADYKICADVRNLLDTLNHVATEDCPPKLDWLKQCQAWRAAYPVVQMKHRQDKHPNIYVFYDELTRRLNADDYLLVSVGTARVVGSQTAQVTEGMRFITNPSMAAMGYDLPAAVGVATANHGQRTILVTGEGSLQMNLQEFQTIIQNKLPIIIFVLNNQGYHSIRMTQSKFFHPPLIGVGEESHDLSFPDLSKLVPAYGMGYSCVKKADELSEKLDWALSQKQPVVCELMLSKEYCVEPKAASKMLENGKMVSASLDDMAPFLPEEEVKKNRLNS